MIPMDLKSRLLHWRTANWPPKKLTRCLDLPIYMGPHEDVYEFGQVLAEFMGTAADHIYQRGKRVPRWMQIPKIFFQVERVNILKTTSKTSKRCRSLNDLTEKCGAFSPVAMDALSQWFGSAATAEVVAHKSIVDIRAYISTKGKELPLRKRFLDSGLVLAVEDGYVLQDHRDVVRKARSDRYENPIAQNDGGWRVFPLLRGKTCDRSDEVSQASSEALENVH
jgi:hypothetical protein